jgi:hypothetical protein
MRWQIITMHYFIGYPEARKAHPLTAWNIYNQTDYKSASTTYQDSKQTKIIDIPHTKIIRKIAPGHTMHSHVVHRVKHYIYTEEQPKKQDLTGYQLHIVVEYHFVSMQKSHN